ncbi:MAG: exopolyphosphatase / guanosine-5-triphosphate,3-diphosphate pyrophosphatase [Actinomycetota bacterium]|nr:exopolyphosphatase / guanosine-5-triphosphate,3-diphosphate pyrophosphatase [Actinomycetota bacterium]
MRGQVQVAHRCPCGQPDVVATPPRLPDGSPFPTTFYLTCPRATAALSTLESEGVMARLAAELAADPAFAADYRSAHEDYLARRANLGAVPEIDGVSAGGMPDRVKCLHALVAHSLAAGPGVNPVGDEALSRLAARGMWSTDPPCVPRARVAAIDCGTNSIRLLISEPDGATGVLRDVVRELQIVRLGEGLGRTGLIGEPALARTFAACDDYAETIAAANVVAVRFVATSASRDAGNRDVFTAGVQARIGVLPEVITGAEEARLSFVGAIASPRVAAAAMAPRLVVDIGGGSTEFVLGDDTPVASRSVDIGCVRLAERHLHSDPPTAPELAAVAADADEAIALAAQVVPLTQAASLVGLAGTVTTVAALSMGLAEYDAAVIHGARISAAEVHRVTGMLGALTLAERERLPAMVPGRADVIVAGSIILSRIMIAAQVDEVIVSEHDILDGIVGDLARLT